MKIFSTTHMFEVIDLQTGAIELFDIDFVFAEVETLGYDVEVIEDALVRHGVVILDDDDFEIRYWGIAFIPEENTRFHHTI